MAVNKAVEARKKAKAKREARQKKAKEGGKKTLSKLSGLRKKLGIGVSKEEWKKGESERKTAKAERKAARIKVLDDKRKARKAKRAKTKVDAPEKVEPKKAEPKKEVAPQKFGSAFSSARKAGKKTFTWKGKSYTTKTADDVKKAKKVKPKGKTFGKESLKKAAKKATDVSDKLQYQTPMKDVIDTKDRLAKRGDYREETKDVPVKPDEPWKADEDKYRTSKAEGGIVESNPFGWPTRDARNGGNK